VRRQINVRQGDVMVAVVDFVNGETIEFALDKDTDKGKDEYIK